MLKPKKLILSNFCQHAHRVLDFQQGMTAIIGANFSGKSNLFRGFVYALTGWCDPAWGTQSALQKDDEQLPGYAELEFEADGELYRVKRYTLTGAKYKDSLSNGEGKELILQRQKVNQWLEDKVGVQLPVLAQLIWVRQENSSWLLTAPSTAITTFLAQIFDTKKLEKLRDSLKTASETIAFLRSDFDSRAVEAQEKLNGIPDTEMLTKALLSTKEALDKASEQLVHYQDLKDPEEQRNLITAIENRIVTAKNNIDVWQQYAGTELQSTYSTIEELQEEREKTNKIISDADDDIAYVKMEIRNLNKQLEDLDSTTEKFSHCPNKCELCNSEINDKQKYMLNKQELFTGVNPEERSKELIKQLTKAKLSLSQYENTKKTSEQFLTFLDQDFWFLKIKQTQEALKKLEENVETLKQEKVADVESIKAKEHLEHLIALKQQDTQEILKEMSTAEANKKFYTQVLEQCSQDKASYERNNKIREIFTRTRDVLSQKRSQARYMQNQISRLNQFITEYMTISEMPFNIRLDPQERLFKYKMEDSEIEHPSAQLSGAQKAVASIAIQMALIATVAPDINTICVDETDAALSPENKFMAATLYRSLVEALAGDAGSVLVISQSEAVLDDVDNTYTM